MGGGGKGEEGGGETVQTQTQDVWGGQAPYLDGMYSQANDLWNYTNQGMQAEIPGSVDWMNSIRDQSEPYWQNQMQGGAYAGMDLQNQYNNALNTGGGNEMYVNEQVMGGQGNDYADAMKGQVMADAQGMSDQYMRGLDGRAAASGMSGGSRHGTATAQGLGDINANAQNQLTNIGYDSFDKNLNRMSDIARRADTYDMDKLNNLSGMLGQQQNTMNQGLAGSQDMQGLGMGAFSPYQQSWDSMGQYSNTIGRPTVLSSSSMTQTPTSSGGGSKGLGSMAGSVAGGFFGGPAGAAAGGAAGGMLDG